MCMYVVKSSVWVFYPHGTFRVGIAIPILSAGLDKACTEAKQFIFSK